VVPAFACDDSLKFLISTKLPMRFFKITADYEWRMKHEAGSSFTWNLYMPRLNCPTNCAPIRCTEKAGHSYPAIDFSDQPAIRRQLKPGDLPMARWQKLHAAVIAALPYPLPILPGTHFGKNQIEISGPAADCYPHYHFVISEEFLQKVRGAGIQGLFPGPILVKSKRALPSKYFELQIEHTASLAGSLDIAKKLKRLRAGGMPITAKELRCSVCGRDDGELPSPPVLKGSSIPEGIHIFRLSEKPLHIFCTEQFALAAKNFNATNIRFECVRTDGSEKKAGFAKVFPSRPEASLRSPSATPKIVASSKSKKPRAPKAQPSIEKLIARFKLKPHADSILSIARPTIRFTLNPVETTSPGRSKFGGLPNLPKTLIWPGSANAPLDFLLQINLQEIAEHIPAHTLPGTGFLWFFYDTDKSPWITTSKDKLRASRVLYSNCSASDPGAAKAPDWLSTDAILPTCSLNFAAGLSLPSTKSPAFVKLNLKKEERTRYEEFLQTLNGAKDDEPCHKLLGYPNEIQNEMTSELNAALSLPKTKQPDWRLLLQLDSDENGKIQWSDSGRLYFWITSADLAAKTFDRSALILQSF
jgi:uncharacterized protein YwqG